MLCQRGYACPGKLSLVQGSPCWSPHLAPSLPLPEVVLQALGGEAQSLTSDPSSTLLSCVTSGRACSLSEPRSPLLETGMIVLAQPTSQGAS